MKNWEFFLPIKRQAEAYFYRFMDPDIVELIYDLIIYRRSNEVNEFIISKRFAPVREAEINFYNNLPDIYHEIEQILYLSPPIIHVSLRKRLREDLAALKADCEVKKIKNILRKTGSKKILKLIEQPDVFDEYYFFIDSLLQRLEKEFLFFSANNFETKFFTEDHLGTVNKSDFAPSILTGPKIEDFIIDAERFQSICEKLSTNVSTLALKKKGEVKIMARDKNGHYLWIGIGKRGSIPLLASFVKRLIEIDVIRFIHKEPFAKVLITFLNVPVTKSTSNTLSKMMEDEKPEYRAFFREQIPN